MTNGPEPLAGSILNLFKTRGKAEQKIADIYISSVDSVHVDNEKKMTVKKLAPV